MWRLVLAVAGPVAALVTRSGGASESSSRQRPSVAGVAAVGEASEFDWQGAGTGQLTVHSMRWTQQPMGDLVSAPTNGAFLVCDVTVASVAGSVGVNPLYFRAIDADGGTAESSSAIRGDFRPRLESGELMSGEHRRGVVAFDMQQGAGTLELQTPLGDALIRWALPVS